MPQTILIVDDDALLRRSLAFNLEQAGYRVHANATAEEALATLRTEPIDLVLLDIGLPGMDGLEALSAMRRQMSATPVIFLTARRRELDQALGLGLGADDYVTKPFDLSVLLARIKAVLRRTARSGEEVGYKPGLSEKPGLHPTSSPVQVGDLAIDPAAHTVTVAGRSVDLSPREFDLLLALAREAGRVVAVDDLLARVWGAEYAGETQVVYVHIRWLREKIESDPNRPVRIVTVRRVGYKLVA